MWWVPCSLWYKMGEYLDWSGAQGVRVTVISKGIMSRESLMVKCHIYLEVYLGHCQTSLMEL